MAGNAQSGVTLKKTMIKKYGSEEAWKEHMRQNGRIGGTISRGGGFSHGDNGRKFGALGGSRSKRGYQFKLENDEYMEYTDKVTGENVKFYK